MDSNLSLTTGCFVHKKSGKKKSAGKGKPVDALNHKQYEKLWEMMEKKIQNIEENAYTETFDGLVKFVKSCDLATISDSNEIPAAILVMGVNMPDHSNIFRLLEQQMHLNNVFTTVVLQSKECSTLSNLMQKLVSTVIDKYEPETGVGNSALKKMEYTFSKLLSCYDTLPSTVLRSPRKSKKKNSNPSNLKSSPIVIFIQDVEAFTISVLQEFILNCNLYVGKLPIVLVFGMASAMVTLHNILPQKALCCLGIETFYSMTAIEYLTKIVQEVILDPENPFKLGPKVFRLIVDTVLYHDFSVTNLALLLKFCMLEHFYNNPITMICCNAAEIKPKLQLLSREDLDGFRKLPSFSRFIENNPESKATMKQEKEFKVLIRTLLQNHHAYHRLMIVLLKMLHTLTKDLPTSPFGKHFREVYPMALEDAITAMPCFTQAEKLLKMQSRHEWEIKLSSCLSILNEAESTDSYLLEVKELLLNELEDMNNLDEVGETEMEPSTPFENDIEKITSRSQLQEKLRMRMKAKRSKFDNRKDAIVQTLTTIFKKLHPPSELPLYEVLYFDNVSSIKRHLMVVPRITLHRNLMNPQLHLKCQCCNINNMHQVSPSMPDICTLYKLHLECGKLINLYDWLQAFKSLKENEFEKGNETELNSEFDKQLNIRFMHSISELQLLGFIKPTKRKTDHVARLTFGNF